MKKVMSLILVFAMCVGLCACNMTGGAKDAPKTLQAGYGKAKIQPPDYEIHLTGGGDPNRIANSVLDELYLTCFAITDVNGETLLIYTVDIQNASIKWSEPAREFVSQRTGVPVSNIIFSSTHSHSVPGLTKKTQADIQYTQVFEQGLIQATDDALADRSEAQIFAGTAEGEGLAFVRHYVLDNGSIAGSNFGDFSSGKTVSHVYDADDEAQLLKFHRPAEDKKDLLMVSWPCHATFNGTTSLKNLSADWPSPTRDYIEQNSDCLVGIFIGGAGNQTPNTRISELDHNQDYRGYGALLGQVVVDALDGLTAVEDGAIKIESKTIETESNFPTDSDKMLKAGDAYQYFLDHGQSEGNTYAKANGFESCYEARAYVNRMALDPTQSLTISAVSLGNLSFVVAPYEMFSKNAQSIKGETPFDMSFMLGYSNGSEGYIPSADGYEYNGDIGCYEAYSSPWPKGTAEMLVDEYLGILNNLRAE